MVRNPVQRSYSHWRMGREWMASRCSGPRDVATLAPLMPLLDFGPLMERSLLMRTWAACSDAWERSHGRATDGPAGAGGAGASPAVPGVPPSPTAFNRLTLPAGEISHLTAWRSGVAPLDAAATPTFTCLREGQPKLTESHLEELMGNWTPKAEKKALADAVGAIGRCSEMMLFPPAALLKGSSYAEELNRWASVFPRDQIKVIHTDELSKPLGAQRIMDETFRFIGIGTVGVGRDTRMCVHGKAGVMDVPNVAEGELHVGSNGTGARSLDVGKCNQDTEGGAGMHQHESTGALHYNIDLELQERMRAFLRADQPCAVCIPWQGSRLVRSRGAGPQRPPRAPRGRAARGVPR